jgi:replicative DNA helicase
MPVFPDRKSKANSGVAHIRLGGELGAEIRGEIRPIHTGLPCLDDALGEGLRPGELTVVAGSPAAAKTILVLGWCRQLHLAGRKWRYLGLEGDTGRSLRRLLAIHGHSWLITEVGADMAEGALKYLQSHEALAEEFSEGLVENPREGGGEFAYRHALEIADELAIGRDLVVLDPLAQIDPDKGTKQQWESEQAFIRRLGVIAASSRCHLVLVVHTRKSNLGPRASMSQDDLQGAAALTRLADNVIGLERHDQKWSEVFSSECSVEHQRTLHCLKIRHGAGTGIRIACDLGAEAPVFKTYGTIKPKRKGS